MSDMWIGVVFKNRRQKDMCLKEIGLCAENVVIIWVPWVNVIGGLYDHLMSASIVAFDNE